MLKWTKINCPQAKFLLKTDDDMFINTRALTNYLFKPEVKHRDNLIFGLRLDENTPKREQTSKW